MTASTTKPDTSPTDYQRLGGEAGLRRIVADFVDRVFDDVIIGFLFVGVDRATLVEREVAFAAAHLGGPQRYAGRPIGAVHRKHPINRGHFHRRLWLLEQTLTDHGADRDVIDRWLEHNRGLEKAITTGLDCLD